MGDTADNARSKYLERKVQRQVDENTASRPVDIQGNPPPGPEGVDIGGAVTTDWVGCVEGVLHVGWVTLEDGTQMMGICGVDGTHVLAFDVSLSGKLCELIALAAHARDVGDPSKKPRIHIPIVSLS